MKNQIRLIRLLPVLLLCAVSTLSDGSPQKPPQKRQFAFWYEDWIQNQTLPKLGPANVIIGVPPEALPEVHKSGRKALQYITYYQSTFHHALLKDNDDLANVGFFNAGKYLPSAFGGPDNYVLCPNSINLRKRIADQLESLLKQGYDGLFVDNAFQPPATELVCQAAHAHATPGAKGADAYLDLLNALRTQLKAERPDAVLVVNAGSPEFADKLASSKYSLWELSDYILWESFGYSSYRGNGHDRWDTALPQALKYSSDPQKRPKLILLSYPLNTSEALYAFAIARIFGFTWTANTGERDRDTEKDAGHFGVYLEKIPGQLGEPKGNAPTELSDAPLRRCFERGAAYANTGPADITILAPAPGILNTNNQNTRITKHQKFALPSHTAAVIIFARSSANCHF